jgi:PAS domain S-box-containing protein
MVTMRRFGFDPHSLPAQMILGFVALVLLTAVAAGLPAIWLIRDQLGRQAWAQVDQGRRAAQALYSAKQGEMGDLATLTAQRPTLRDLLGTGDVAALSTYLQTLKTGAGLDRVLICDYEQRLIAGTDVPAADSVCAFGTDSGFYIGSADPTPQVWLFASHPIDNADDNGETQYRVVVAIALDDRFAAQMHDQTGLEHTVLVDGAATATSLIGGAALYQSCLPVDSDADESQCRVTFDQGDVPYYAERIPLSESGLLPGAQPGGLEAEVALSVSEIAATQQRLAWMLAGGILMVAAVGSGVGAILARRISRPLANLTQAATRLSRGDLSSPVAVEAGVREVALVAQALESARADLQGTLEQLRQEKAWTDHLLEAIVEGIVTLDKQGRITFFSHGAERITGWNRDQVIGLAYHQVFKPLETDEALTQLIPAPGRRQKTTVELRDGREATLAVTGARLLPPGGDDAQVALVFRDVSEAEAIHRLLGHFLANVAHEFRTPLAAVAASVELLMDQAPDLNAAELGELLTSLHLGVLGLQTLVDNLLESASIEAGRFRVFPRAANLGEIIAEAIRTMQPLLLKRDQRLVVELPAAIPVVRADSRRTVQVLVNLLSNASKYGPDEAEILISAMVNDRWVKVSVADRGPSIPPDQRKDVFRRFMHPGSADSMAQQGAGLGLSVVKAIVEAHGGQVGVDGRPGGGSVFWFTLPEEHML